MKKQGKIVIAGGSGFIGRYMSRRFRQMGWEVLTISTTPARGYISWSDEPAMVRALDHAWLVLNLAGKSVDCRYNQKNMDAIFASRTETTRKLGEAIEKCKNPPGLWLNASTGTIYRYSEDIAMTEENGVIGKGFSVEVAKAWEKAFFKFKLPHTRQVALRMAIVLGRGGGALTPYARLVSTGAGGRHGNGRQMFSWIHIEDLFRIVFYIAANSDFKGVVNCASPQAVTNTKLMKTLREVKGMPLGMPLPRLLLRLGAWLTGTEAELVLKSRWVYPERLLKYGFEFKYPALRSALEDILLRSK